MSKSLYKRIRLMEERLNNLEQWRKHCEGLLKPTKNGDEISKVVQESVEKAFPMEGRRTDNN